jgi:long-chain fatty acid transport protein
MTTLRQMLLGSDGRGSYAAGPAAAAPLAATIALLALALATDARASGFGLNEHGAKAMGMAGAYTAVASTPEATYFNPAGLATLSGIQLEVGGTLITPGMSYTGQVPGTNQEATVDAKRLFFFIPNVHTAFRLHDRIAAGLSVYVPYGLTTEWPKTVTINGEERGWWARGISEKISLETFYLNPAVALKLHPRIFLGAGLTIAKAAVTLNRGVTLSANPAEDIDVNLSGDDWGFGGTAGILIKVLPEMLNAGFTFRSGVGFGFEGSAAFTKGGKAADVPAGLRTRLVDSPVEAKLNLPHVFSFGVAAFPMKALTIAFAFDVITWSSYDKLEMTFKDPKDPSKVNSDLSVSEPKNWNNTIVVRVGAEYRVLPQLPLRLGFIFDQGPPPPTTIGPELPDGDRYEFTLGGGYEFKGLSVDLAYQFLTSGTIKTAETAPLVGTYSANAHLVGLSLGYKFSL